MPPSGRLVAICACLVVAGLCADLSTGWPQDWLTASQAETLRLAAFTLVVAIAGSEIARGALANLRGGEVGVELLVLVAAAGAMAIGHAGQAAAAVFVFVCGNWLEARAHRDRAAFARAPVSTGAHGPETRTQRAMSFVAGWYTPTVLAIAGAALALTGNIPLALALLVIARPRALIVWIGTATRGAVLLQNLALAICAALALLVGVVAGAVPMAEAMLIQQASALVVVLNAARPPRGAVRPARRD